MNEILTEMQGLFEKLCVEHDFRVVEVGINKEQDDQALFCAALHYDGATEGNGCSLGNGPTIAAALNSAYVDACRKRKPQLVREAA